MRADTHPSPGAVADAAPTQLPDIPGSKRVYIVDDDSMVRRSLYFLLSTVGLDVRSFISGQDFLDESDVLEPGCVLLDLRMPELDGIAVLNRLSKRVQRFPVVMITGHGEVEIAVRAMKCGAIDFLEKPFTDAALMEVLDAVFLALPAKAEADADRANAQAKVARLTPREREVLQGLVDGLATKGVAHRLNISVRTAEAHRDNMRKRLGVHSLAELLQLAIQGGVKPS